MRFGHDRQQLRDRRQPRDAECELADSRNFRGDPLKELRRKLKRQTPIARPMSVPTLETRAGISEQQRARQHESRALRGTVLERATRHERNTHRAMALFKSRLARTC